MKVAQRKRLEELAYQQSRKLEKEGEPDQAIKGYRAMLKKNPLHIGATARLLIIYRKKGELQQEIQLLESSLSGHNAYNALEKKNWIAAHRQLAEDSKALAGLLGMSESAVLPSPRQEILTKWKLRLQRLKEKLIRDKQLLKKRTTKKKKPASK